MGHFLTPIACSFCSKGWHDHRLPYFPLELYPYTYGVACGFDLQESLPYFYRFYNLILEKISLMPLSHWYWLTSDLFLFDHIADGNVLREVQVMVLLATLYWQRGKIILIVTYIDQGWVELFHLEHLLWTPCNYVFIYIWLSCILRNFHIRCSWVNTQKSTDPVELKSVFTYVLYRETLFKLYSMVRERLKIWLWRAYEFSFEAVSRNLYLAGRPGLYWRFDVTFYRSDSLLISWCGNVMSNISQRWLF